MPLIDLKTDLKSLKYGKDRPGGGNSGQPYQKVDINTVDSDFNRFRMTKFDDGLVRGGVVGAANASIVDTLRIGKFLKDFPKGPLFITKQIGLQLTNPIQEHKTNFPTNRPIKGQGLIANVSNFISNVANKILNAVGPTRIYNLGINTLAQVPVNAFGQHIVRHGFTPRRDDDNLYFKVAQYNNNEANNRLVQLKYILGTADNINDGYIGGPGSIYGLGTTVIHRRGKFIDINRDTTETVWATSKKIGDNSSYNLSKYNNVLTTLFVKKALHLGLSNEKLSNLSPNYSLSIPIPDEKENLKEKHVSPSDKFNLYRLAKDPVNYYKALGLSKEYFGPYTLFLTTGISEENANTTPTNINQNAVNELADEFKGYQWTDVLSQVTKQKEKGVRAVFDQVLPNISIDYYGKLGVSKQYFDPTSAEFSDTIQINPSQSFTTPTYLDRTTYSNLYGDYKELKYTDKGKIENLTEIGLLPGKSKNTTYATYKKLLENKILTNNKFKDSNIGYDPVTKTTSGSPALLNDVDFFKRDSNDKITSTFDPTYRKDIFGTHVGYINSYSEVVKIKAPDGWLGLSREQRVGSGRQDKINLTPLLDLAAGTQGDNLGGHNINDLVKFRIQSLNGSDPSQATYMIFRAFITQFSDNSDASWNEIKYAGRGDKFYVYDSFSRKINIGFKVAALSAKEMEPMYQKLNYLMGNVMPDYNNNLMRGNLIKMTVGNWIDGQDGILNNVSYTIPQDSPWEIAINEPLEGTKELILPHIVEVSMTFTPIGSQTKGQNKISQKSKTTSHIAQNVNDYQFIK